MHEGIDPAVAVALPAHFGDQTPSPLGDAVQGVVGQGRLAQQAVDRLGLVAMGRLAQRAPERRRLGQFRIDQHGPRRSSEMGIN